MKTAVRFVLVVICAACLLSADCSKGRGYNKGYGLCGIWVEITTQRCGNTGHLNVAVKGEPGSTMGTEHDWTELTVLIEVFDPIVRKWSVKFDCAGPGMSWSDSFNVDGYSRYKVNAKGYDSCEAHRGRAIANVEEALYH